MINIKNCFLIVMCIMSIYHVTISAQGCPCASDLKEIQKAVNGEAKAIDNKTVTPQADSVVSALSKIFVLQPKTKVGDSEQSILDAKIDLYAKDFYKWYGKDAFKEVVFDEIKVDKKTKKAIPGKNTNKNTNNSATLFAQYGRTVLREDCINVDAEVNNKIQDYIDKSLPPQDPEKLKDQKTPTERRLLLDQVEKYLQDAKTPTKGDKKPKESAYPEMLNPLKMIETTVDENTTYTNQSKNFIASLENSLPPLKTFYFPPASDIKDGQIKITSPLYNDQENKRTTLAIKLKEDKSMTPVEMYQTKIDLLKNNPAYQSYALKIMSDLSIRCGLLSNIVYMFKKREKPETNSAGNKSTALSLADKERDMALEGLDPKYYGTDDKPITAADLNLKTLHTNNKTLYFMYRILQQIEYANYIQSLKSLQEQQLTEIQDEQNIRRINNIISTDFNK